MVDKIICFGQKYSNAPNGIWISTEPLKLQNPHSAWVGPLTGLHTEVRKWLDNADALLFGQVVNDFETEIILRTGTIGICCSGGRHRSPAVLVEAILGLFGIMPIAATPGIPEVQFLAPEAARMYGLCAKYMDYQKASNGFIRGEQP